MDDELDFLNEEIDFSDPNMLLQNLKLSIPTLNDDKTYMLQGRKDVADVVSLQVMYYCYSALQCFLSRSLPPSILIFGDGFIGSRIIDELCSCGCSSFIKIYTRGDFSAKEWKARGLKSDSSLLTLLNGQKPDIIIINTESSSFPAVCHIITSNHILSTGSFIISTSFGFQRKKVYNNLKIPSIFRTFVEPQRRLVQLKSKLFTKQVLSAVPDGNVALDDISSIGDHMRLDDDSISLAESEGVDDDMFRSLESSLKSERKNVLNSIGESSNSELQWEDAALSSGGAELAALYTARRIRDIRNLLYLTENFYALQGMLHHDARLTALKTVFNFDIDVDEESISIGMHTNRGTSVADSLPTVHSPAEDLKDRESISSRGAQGEAVVEKESIERKLLNSVLRSLHDKAASAFQQFFRARISLDELRRLAMEFPVDHDPLRAAHGQPFGEKGRFYVLQEDFGHRVGSVSQRQGGHAQAMMAAARRRRGLRRLPIYSENFVLKEIFSQDSDYKAYTGPGFDYLAMLDGNKIQNSSVPKIAAVGLMGITEESGANTVENSTAEGD